MFKESSKNTASEFIKRTLKILVAIALASASTELIKSGLRNHKN